ncbi:hypothetical protein AAFC00_002786 [Neodothiora populina]|uniref:C3H1-type domain-containing protein n=1 Tax=Neodothiora populina TaxID=2781224 RepID=A0ABR3P882_9PEZI
MAGLENHESITEDGTMTTLLQEYKTIRSIDANRDSLIEDLLQRYQYVSGRLVQERADFDRERQWQSTRELEEILDRNPFVLVLIDGSDLVFRNSYLCDGDNGGRRCAAKLHQALNEHIFSTIDDLPSETKVLVRVYVDLEELADLCLQNKIIQRSDQIGNFARGFVQDRALFDIVNVYSSGRATIIDKIEAQLNLHLYERRCKQIILGCSDESVYAPMLQDLASSEGCRKRISLLSGLPLDPELEELPFCSLRMPGIFRNTQMEVHHFTDQISEMVPAGVMSLPSVIGVPLGPPTPPISTPALSARPDSGLDNFSSKMSIASPRTSIDQSSPRPITWASTAIKGMSFPVKSASKIFTMPEPPEPKIRCNKYGERLNPIPPVYKREEVNRIRTLKLCNAHYLRHGCAHPDEACVHEHGYKCTKSEIETLKLIARMSPCIHGPECGDESCIHGHNCPFPGNTDSNKRGKVCSNGSSCRFPANMHGQDITAVRTSKVT